MGIFEWPSAVKRLKVLAGYQPRAVSQDIPHGVWHKVQIFGGHPTEMYGINQDANVGEVENLQVIVVPGNPGAISFYTPFLKYLHSMLKGHPRVIGVSFLGHESGIHLHGKRAFSLQEQIAHKEAVLWGLCGAFKGKTIVIGHSIGAYMALKAVESLRAKNFLGSGKDLQIVALFPFLAKNPSCLRQRRLTALTMIDAQMGLATMFMGVMSYLPIKWIGYIAALCDQMLDPHAVWALVGLVDAQHARNALHMGYCEFRCENSCGEVITCSSINTTTILQEISCTSYLGCCSPSFTIVAGIWVVLSIQVCILQYTQSTLATCTRG